MHTRRTRMNDMGQGRPDGSQGNVVFTISPLLFETTGCILDSPGLNLTSIERLNTRRPTSTYITFTEWRTFARETIGLREQTCINLFDAFHTLSSKPESRVENTRLLLGKMSGVVDNSRYKTAAATRVVNLPGFCLFLLAQSHLQSREQPDPMSFVRHNMTAFVSAVGVTKPQYVTQRDLQELGLVFREYIGDVEQVFGTSLAHLYPNNERVADVNTVASFIRARLVPVTDLRNPTAGNVTVTANNSAIQILQHPLGPQPTRFPGYTFRIVSAAQTTFYVPSVVPNTVVTALSNCVVQLGPVSGVLWVNNCENCTISAICGSVVVSHCANVTLFVCTNTPPIIIDSSAGAGGDTAAVMDGVMFAPYNTHYANLEEHIAASGLNPKLNLWRIGVPEAMILPPGRFVSASFPVAPQTTAAIVTRTNPCPLPREYQDALTQRVNAFNSTSALLQQTYKQLENSGRRDLAENLRTKVQAMFLDWVYEKGQVKGLVDLLHNNSAGNTM